jgi:hypothetical protein
MLQRTYSYMVQLLTRFNLRSPIQPPSEAGMLSATGPLQTAPQSRSNLEPCVQQPISGIPTEPDVPLTAWRNTRAGPTDEAQELLLVQMRYEEHLAKHALQVLFESEMLESLCG